MADFELFFFVPSVRVQLGLKDGVALTNLICQLSDTTYYTTI